MSSPTLDCSHPITPSDLHEMELMADDKAAEVITERAKFIDCQDRLTFMERGMLAEYVEKRVLWQCVDNPRTGIPCGNQNEWIEAFCPFSRASWFDAKRRWKELAEIPAEERVQIPRHNVIVMQKLSSAVRKDPEVIKAAQTMPQDDFLKKIEVQHPDQHLEAPKGVLKFKPSRTGAEIIEKWVSYAIAHEIAESRDEAMVKACEYALHDAELDEELKSMPDEQVFGRAEAMAG